MKTALLTKVITTNDTLQANQYHGIRIRNLSEVSVKINENITLFPREKWEWINDVGVMITTGLNIRFDTSSPTNRVEIELYY